MSVLAVVANILGAVLALPVLVVILVILAALMREISGYGSDAPFLAIGIVFLLIVAGLAALAVMFLGMIWWCILIGLAIDFLLVFFFFCSHFH